MVLIIYVIWPKSMEREQSFVTENVHVAAERRELRMGFFILFHSVFERVEILMLLILDF